MSFEKLAAAEDAFFTSQFFSPVLKNSPIRVRIAGVVVTLKVTQPKDYFGWGVFSAINFKTAKFVRDPNLREKEEYFKLFPKLRLILCRKDDNNWFGIPASQSDGRFKITGTVPIQLATEVQLFDIVQACFDGTNVWFEQIDSRHSPKTSVYLRENLAKLVEVAKLDVSGLTIEEKDAYALALHIAVEADAEAKRDKQEERIKTALHRVGAKYKSYIERGDTYTIEFTVNNRTHRSVVKKDNLAVESAGICLAGTDRNFDLQSLVGVIKEGYRNGRIVPVGLNREYGDPGYYTGADEDDDW